MAAPVTGSTLFTPSSRWLFEVFRIPLTEKLNEVPPGVLFVPLPTTSIPAMAGVTPA